MADDTTSHGFWASQQRMDEFDEFAAKFQEGPNYSRSEAIRNAMAMYETVLETMADLDWPVEDMSERDRRAAVRQAILNDDARDSR